MYSLPSPRKCYIRKIKLLLLESEFKLIITFSRIKVLKIISNGGAFIVQLELLDIIIHGKSSKEICQYIYFNLKKKLSYGKKFHVWD